MSTTELTGQLTLTLATAVRQRNFNLFRQTLREMGKTLDDSIVRGLFRIIQRDLDEAEQVWWGRAIAAVLAGKETLEDSDNGLDSGRQGTDT
jgi:hypothetical protein